MKYKIGNIVDALLLNQEIDLFVQGCNCFCHFGGGLAAEVRERIPEAVIADDETEYGSKNKLGTYSVAELEQGLVINAYTQYHHTDNLNDEIKTDDGFYYILVNYDAVRSVMKEIYHNYSDKKIGLPLIGAGIACGDWNIIEQIIKEELVDKDVDVTIYVLEFDLHKIDPNVEFE